MNHPRPTALIILDGFGYNESPVDNAIAHANTPTWDQLWANRPKRLISGSGFDVGLPDGQMGNSEVGHLNLGAGRVVYQDYTRITSAIDNGEFAKNPVLLNAIEHAVRADKAIHVMGLLSPGGVHSHENHIWALIRLAAAKGASRIYLHAFLDGRDMPPKSAESSLIKAQALFRELGLGGVASISGRYFAMDRDKRWDRIASVYRLLTEGIAERTADDAISALRLAYEQGETDEFVKPTRIDNSHQPFAPIQDGDSVFFMNYRADRARQLTQALTLPEFEGFERPCFPKVHMVTLTEYEKGLPVNVAFSPLQLKNVLGEVLSQRGYRQLRIAETEKYAHVTFFFNGGVEAPFPGEDRKLIPSPKVATYDQQPEMNAPKLTQALVETIESGAYDCIVCNYANPDMVGHTGNFEATVKAIETIDQCLAQVVSALERVGGQAIITADHGNAEKMRDPETGQPHTAHTNDPVPCVYIGPHTVRITETKGVLADVAPTLLHLMNETIPQEMTGTLLFEKQS